MTKQEKITAWLQSHGFTYFRGKYSKLNDETGFTEVINEHQAEFFYDLTQQARIDELTTVLHVNESASSPRWTYENVKRRLSQLKQEGKTNG